MAIVDVNPEIAAIEKQLRELIEKYRSQQNAETQQIIVSFINNAKLFEEKLKKYKQLLDAMLKNNELRSALAKSHARNLFDINTASSLSSNLMIVNQIQALGIAERDVKLIAPQLIQSWHDFRIKLQELAGTVVKTIYVSGTKTSSQLYDITNLLPKFALGNSLTRIAREGEFSRSFITFRYSNSAVGKKNLSSGLVSTMGTAAEVFGISDPHQITYLNSLFNEIENRMQISAERGGGKYLMWNLNDQWHKIATKQLGDMREAYIALLVSGTVETMMHEAPTYDAAIDWFTRNFMAKVDNGLASFIDDIKVKQNEYYAIKSKGAGMGGYKDLLTLAQMLVSDKIISATEIAQMAKTIVGFDRNNIETMTDAAVIDACNKAGFKVGVIPT